MKEFTIYHSTEGTKYTGCAEILQTIKVLNLKKAIEWVNLWCCNYDVTRVCGKNEEWIKPHTELQNKLINS